MLDLIRNAGLMPAEEVTIMDDMEGLEDDVLLDN